MSSGGEKHVNSHALATNETLRLSEDREVIFVGKQKREWRPDRMLIISG